MGLYTWLNENEFKTYLVLSDDSLNEIYQEVRELFPQVYVQEKHFTKKSWLGKSNTHTEYSIYVKTDLDGSEVRCMNIASHSKELLINFFFGLLNGHHWTLEKQNQK